jgi:uncharacterized membrane protein YcgQ (UPF0703/DUF1980 family)
MKKIPLVSLIAVFFFIACGNTKTVSKKTNTAGTLSVVLPAGVSESGPLPVQSSVENTIIEPELVYIGEKMFMAQTNDVYLNPEDYIGKTIKLEGLFKAEQYGENAPPYCFVLRYGPGCCGNDGNAGFEVAWNEQRDTIKPYPNSDDWVEAVGVLKTYEEDGYPYLYLALSELNVLDKRGAEYVTQ